MKLIRLLLILFSVLLLIAVAWCWWNWPRRVDMAQYAPAESLIYLECNSLADVAETIAGSEAWKEFGSSMGLREQRPTDRWLYFAASLGIGPAQGVVLSRAQVAAVMLNIDAAEENETLRIKPEGAIIIETHTSGWRMRPVVELALQRFAEKAYGSVTPKTYREDADYFEWTALAGDRKIVAAIDNSAVVIGNTKRAVQKCLEARRGQQPSLGNDAGLRQMRTKVGATKSLAFGYVSGVNATRLFSWGAPLFLGKGPGDATLEQIITRNAAKVLGPIGWSSQAASGGIEDRFFFSLEPSVVSRLRPAFRNSSKNNSLWKVVPSDLETMTIYRSETPALAWEALRAVSSQFDTLSAVVFASILKAALRPYGIENPEKFLQAVGPELATVKVHAGSQSSVLVARVLDRSVLERMFGISGKQASNDRVLDLRLAEPSDRKLAAAFVDDYLVIGGSDDVRLCADARKSGRTMSNETRVKTLADFATQSSSSILTYADDTDRVRNFLLTMTTLQGSALPPNSVIADRSQLPFAMTETRLEDQGLDRRTRSAFGQFSTLVGLLKRD